jgi:hypothetical protein
VRNFWHRPLGSKLILLLSIALLIEMFAPWQRVCAITSGGENPRVCGWKTAYSGANYGLYAALLAVAIIVWELLPIVFPRLGMRSWAPSIVSAVLSAALVVCVIAKMITDNEFQTKWAWIGLAIAVAILVTAFWRLRYRWGLRGEQRPPPAPSEVATPPPQVEPPPVGGSST